MRRLFILIALAAFVFSLNGAPSPKREVETRQSERMEFEKRFIGEFDGRRAAPAEALSDDERCDKGSRRTVWRFMLQVGSDAARARFIDAVFSSGRFSSGKMYVFGLGEKMTLLSRKYSSTRFELFCEMADYLKVSRTALSYRMEQLGLLENNRLVIEAEARRKGVT